MPLVPVLGEILANNVGTDRFRFLVRGGIWQVRKRLGHRFVATLPSGAKVFVEPNSSYSSIFYTKWPEGKDLLFFRANRHLGDVFVDVGANVGLFSAYLFDTYREFVLFEPSPSSFRAIEETLRLNPRVNAKAVNIGVADAAGEMDFLDLGRCSTTSRFVAERASGDPRPLVKIACDTLDDRLAHVEGKLSIKIDVEGFEERVLLGARKLLSARRVGLLMFERLGRTNLGRVRRFLDSAGYKIFFVCRDGSVSFDDELISTAGVNLFAVDKDLQEKMRVSA